MKGKLTIAGGLVAALVLAISLSRFVGSALAAPPDTFSLIVSPSPIVATLNPGQTTQLQLKVLNQGSNTENLQIEPRSFVVTNSGQINLGNSLPGGIANWISFSAPKFTVAVGQWFTETVIFKVPKDAGFSYSFALEINRQTSGPAPAGGALLKASIADFLLLNVNRPGATRQLKVPSFTVSKHIYEWLPATFTITFKNTGNSIVQPVGNIFIARSANSKTPIDTLQVNSGGGYILPGTDRSLTASWSDGFPAYTTSINSEGQTTSQHLTWNWSKLSDFRFGHYTASLVAVYNNGSEDVPIQGEVSFWVIPWVVMIVIAVVGLLLLFGLFAILRTFFRIYKRHGKKNNRKSL
ncbi:MAG TPA: hypothetical protein VMR95_01100 [Candidatus Binatia bacterium]|nr:hypothetical protein [Candidatus Binatia bacterium]